MAFHQLTLMVVDGTFAISRLNSGTPIPAWATAGDLCSVTRTPDELSIVCREDVVPAGVQSQGGWRCLRVAGAMPFSVVGVLASLTAPLAEAGISLFAVSTFDTDYLLVQQKDYAAAVAALRDQGHSIG